MANKGASKKNENEPPKISKAEGIDYLYDFYGISDFWDITDLDMKKILKFKENIYAQKIATNLENMIFQGPPIINILDPKGNSREDIAEWYREMLNSEPVDFEEKLHRTVDTWMYFGTFCHSDTIEEKDGKILLTEIRDLPPETLADPAYLSGSLAATQTLIASGRILKGIVRYEDGSVHYWQRQLITMVELENCSHMKSPKYSYNIDGVPLLAPLYKLIPKMNNSWDALMQTENRANVLFLRVNRYATLSDNKTSNWNYCNKVLGSYNRNIFFTLPPDCEPIELSGPVSDIALNTIDVLTKLMISLYSASDFITKGDGTLIGGSNSGETNLFKNTINGIQTKLIKAWTPILNKILEWNGYPGFTVEIKLPEMEFKNEELDFQRGHDIIDAIVKAGVVVGSVNEVRSFFSMEDASPEFLAKASKEWEDAKIKTPPPAVPGAVPGATGVQAGQNGGATGNNKNAKNSQNVKKEENSNNQEINDDQDQLKKNQDNAPTQPEIEKDLFNDLSQDIKDLFVSISKIPR